MMVNRQQQYLSLLGIQAWTRRHVLRPQADMPARITMPVESDPVIKTPIVLESIELRDIRSDWKTLRQRVATCTACTLHETRTQTVFGVGSETAQWLIVGEAPGAEEDRQGEPFVGRAGQLLNNMLFALGLSREAVYIANILKCRPPSNRDPRPEEVVQCEAYLHQQVSLLRPRIILAVGRIAAQNLLNLQENLSQMRGKVFRYADTDIPVVVTYHPAYLLRTPCDKAKAWQDLQLAQSILNSAGIAP